MRDIIRVISRLLLPVHDRVLAAEIQSWVQPIVRVVSSLTASDTTTSYLSTDRKLSM